MNDILDCSAVSVFNTLFEILKVGKIRLIGYPYNAQINQENTKPLYVVNVLQSIHKCSPKHQVQSPRAIKRMFEHNFLGHARIPQ